MDPPQLLPDRFRPAGEAESVWLKDFFSFITEHVHPLLCGPAPSDVTTDVVCPHQLGVCVLKIIQDHMCVTHSLPVSYRPVAVLELVSRQHLACVSNLSWNTLQQRAWVLEAQRSVPGHRALPRVNLLLIGCLRGGRGGEWRLTDASGNIRCECPSPSPLWMNRLVFLPHWNYIPHDAPGQAEAGGHLELIGPPVVLLPDAEQRLAAGPDGGAELSGPVGVREAAGLLQDRAPGRRVSVCGRVGSVCPLLVVAGTTFFCFFLTDGSHRVPILVKDVLRLWWTQCVCVGQSVCVTALRVCVLRGWRGNNILCVTDRSELHTNYTHTDSQLATPPPLIPPHSDDDDCEEAEPGTETVQSAVRIKRSRVISYQGTVTEVVSEGAGLYVMDRKVGLCLAYQPTLRRTLRAGDTVELHHVHFLYRPSPDFPPSMLCACLRSSLRVATFSKVGGASPAASCPGDGVLPRLLLEKNLGVSQYLWTCHLSSQLTVSLVPSVLTQQQCVCVLSWKLMELVWRPGGRGRRDIYSEMLDESHTCPLTQYSVHPAVHQYISVSDLTRYLQSECWSSVSLSSLMPPGGSSLTRSQINTAVSWSCRTQSSDPRSSPQSGDGLRRRPLLLVGVLELPSHASEHALQLRDRTGVVSCVLTETSQEEDGGQRAVFNTAWIGCLVCVRQFTMVTERFIQSDFPSQQHLDQDQYITHKHCRAYLQFSLDHLHILSPSVAMVTHLRQRGEEPDDVEEEMGRGHTAGRTRGSSHSTASSVTMITTSVGGASRPCVSVVIRVEHKEGVSWRNVGVESTEGEAGLTACFSVRAAVIGPVVSWRRDPKNEPMTDREDSPETGLQVVLVFSGPSARWFPVLQPGCFYRLVTAAGAQDPSTLIGCSLPGRRGVELHTDSTLQVPPDWRFHTLTRPLLLLSYRQALSPTVLSVSEVLDCRLELVCLQALVCERISVNNRTSDTHSGFYTSQQQQHTQCVCAGVRLTVCDQSGRSLQVYLDLSHTPYPPGLLPGNTLLLSGLQRKLSRTGSVYCRFLPVSCVTVVSTSSARPPPAPMMHLGMWSSPEQRCTVGRVKGHVVCFLFLQLQWSCSLCGRVFMQSCSSSLCGSTSAVFQSTTKLVLDDGTGEAHVWFSGALVRPLLGLDETQWEGLQRALRVRGHLRVLPQGRSLVCGSGDALLHFLVCVCSEVVCGQLLITCRRSSQRRSEEMKRFSRGERDFMTRRTRPLQLTCLTSPV